MRMPVLPSLLLAVLAALAATLSVACGSDSPGPVAPVDPVPTSMAVSPNTLALEALEAIGQLSATVLDQGGNAIAGASVTWSSDAPAVATVDASGRVTAVSVGSANVTATSGTLSGAAEVTVSQVPAEVVVSPAAVELRTEDEATLAATAADANGHPIPDAPVVWSSSDEGVATVDAQSGVVTAVAEGEATITASSGEASGTAGVTVLAPPEDFEPTADATLGGTVDFGAVTIPAGVTITVTEDLTLRARGPVTIEGSLLGDCTAVSVEAAGPLTLQGATVENSCSTPTADAPALTLFTQGELVVEESMVRSAGDLLVTNDPEADFDDEDFGDVNGAAARVAATGQDEMVRTCRVSRTTLEIRDAADGAFPGAAGAGGGRSRLLCDGAGIYRNVTLIGGDGGDGAEDRSTDGRAARGGDGGMGGSTALLARPMKLRESIRHFPGDGGDGGDAIHAPSAPGAAAFAFGGQGGFSGTPSVVSLDDPTEIDGMADIFIRWASGGNGGSGRAIGADGAPGQAGGAAEAEGGWGEGMYVTGILFGTDSRSLMNNVQEADRGLFRFTTLEAGHGGSATGISGKGGDGVGPGDPGAPGGDASVSGGRGGVLNLQDNGPTPFEQIPGNGGDALFRRGLGGNGQPDICRPGGQGGRGGNASGMGGGRPGETRAPGGVVGQGGSTGVEGFGTGGARAPAAVVGQGGRTIIESFGNGGDGADGTGGGGAGSGGSNGVVLEPGAPAPEISSSFMPGSPGGDIPCQAALNTDFSIKSDPNGHNPFTRVSDIGEMLVRMIGGAAVSIAPAGMLPELTGPTTPAEGQASQEGGALFDFSLEGTGTIVGIPDVVVTFDGILEVGADGRPLAMNGELVVDAENDRLPPNQDGERNPSIYDVKGSR
ncbi:MAG: Ig-like domain-containing protein [Gemmatimonadota bacterium]